LRLGVVVFDTKKAELVAQKILAQHSTRMKAAFSELVLQTVEDLRSPEVRPKDRAMAMVALKTVCDRAGIRRAGKHPQQAREDIVDARKGPRKTLLTMAEYLKAG
jgi:hypothetical protein